MPEEIYIVEAEYFQWQSHHHSVVRLVNGINAFIGTSNSGKTALLRGMKWVLRNQPSGANFITRGKKETWVSLTLSNGYKIKRRRTRSGDVNTYEIFKDGVPLHEHPLTGFGTGVPQEVLDVCGMERLDINFAGQLESAFLISNTPKARADAIGNLEELQRIDEALSGTNDDIKAGNKRLKELNKSIAQQEKEAEALRNQIEKDTPKIEALLRLKEAMISEQQTLHKIQGYQRRISEIETILQEQQAIVDKADRILTHWDDGLPQQVTTFERLQKSLARLLEIEEELSTITFMSEAALNQLLLLLEETERDISRCQRISASHQRLNDIESEIKQISGSYSPRVAQMEFTQIDADITIFRTLQRHLSRLEDIEREVSVTETQVEQARGQIDLLLNQFVEALHNERICPTCAQPTEAVSCKHIQEVI